MKDNYTLEGEIFGDFPLSYDNILADAAERTNDRSFGRLGRRAWEEVIDEVFLLAEDILEKE
jgi:hypothetical protein